MQLQACSPSVHVVINGVRLQPIEVALDSLHGDATVKHFLAEQHSIVPSLTLRSAPHNNIAQRNCTGKSSGEGMGRANAVLGPGIFRKAAPFSARR